MKGQKQEYGSLIWPKGFQKPKSYPIKTEVEQLASLNKYLLDKYRFFMTKLIVSIAEREKPTVPIYSDSDDNIPIRQDRERLHDIIIEKSDFVMDFDTMVKDYLPNCDPDYFDAALDSMVGRLQSFGLNLFIEKIETPKCRLIRILL